MTDITIAFRAQLSRQVVHWTLAAEELKDMSRIASTVGWTSLERYLGATLRHSLTDSVARLVRQGEVIRAQLAAAETLGELRGLQREVLGFRRRYLAVEAVLDFYGDAINSRTSTELGALLRACDCLATRSMQMVLRPLGKVGPPVLTYIDRGLGASILKAGLRLWDGRSVSPVAAIKIVRNNLHRPTALIHETGHQVAHILDWNRELASGLRAGLLPRGDALATLWSGWASEIAADALAFAHTGFAAVAALHDVLAGDNSAVLDIPPLDPHPASWLRVLLGREMCRRFFGAGPWDSLAEAWVATYRLDTVPDTTASVFDASRQLLPEIVSLIFERSFQAFGGKSLNDILDPSRVRPDALRELERNAGAALYASSHWLDQEGLRLLALSGYRAATEPDNVREILTQQDEWMSRLGNWAMAA